MRGGEELIKNSSEGVIVVFCMHNERPQKQSTFSGVFRASGNSLSSSRSQRCINCCTIGFSGLTIWNPEMLAPPAKTLSKLTLENPWDETKGKWGRRRLKQLVFLWGFLVWPGAKHHKILAVFWPCARCILLRTLCCMRRQHVFAITLRQQSLFTLCGVLHLQTNNLPIYTEEFVRSSRRHNILLEPADLLSFWFYSMFKKNNIF